MDMKTAMTIAMLFGAMVCGGVFITVAKDGHFLMGLVSGGLIGTVSGLMSLGVLSAFLKKEDKALIRNDEQSVSVKTSHISSPKKTFFKVGNSSLFQKNELSPIEFGREITRLGFQFGVSRCGEYISRESPSALEEIFLKNVQSNPGFLQLLFTNLITGAFHCYAAKQSTGSKAQSTGSGLATAKHRVRSSYIASYLYLNPDDAAKQSTGSGLAI